MIQNAFEENDKDITAAAVYKWVKKEKA